MEGDFTSMSSDAEKTLTLGDVLESVTHAWTDATHLPESGKQMVLCDALKVAAEILDKMIEEEGKAP